MSKYVCIFKMDVNKFYYVILVILICCWLGLLLLVEFLLYFKFYEEWYLYLFNK